MRRVTVRCTTAPFLRSLAAMSDAITADVLPVASDSPLSNADLAPVPLSARKWRTGSIAALWISMSACIPTYMLASSLIGGGMNWWQAVLTIFLGNLIVVVPMILNAHAGTRYGIHFPSSAARPSARAARTSRR